MQYSTVYSNGNKYTGEWQDNKKHGKGTQVWKKSGAIYEGEWKCGKQDGYGTFSVLLPTKEYKRKYCGGWKNGKKHGYGLYFYDNSAVYDGEWSAGHRSGLGRMYYANGDIYEGEWLADKCHGQGTIRFCNGNKYEGAWRDGEKNGNGKLFFSDKSQLYEGFWVAGSAKCGTLSHFEINEKPQPTKSPIPKIQLADADLVLREAESIYLDQCGRQPMKVDSKLPL